MLLLLSPESKSQNQKTISIPTTIVSCIFHEDQRKHEYQSRKFEQTPLNFICTLENIMHLHQMPSWMIINMRNQVLSIEQLNKQSCNLWHQWKTIPMPTNYPFGIDVKTTLLSVFTHLLSKNLSPFDIKWQRSCVYKVITLLSLVVKNFHTKTLHQ